MTTQHEGRLLSLPLSGRIRPADVLCTGPGFDSEYYADHLVALLVQFSFQCTAAGLLRSSAGSITICS